MSAYVGRFAPSPTGRLHLGSLFGALVSYLDAKAHQGRWLVRIEDLDPPREERGASQDIIETLAAHGLEPDEPVLFQSNQYAHYEQRLASLQRSQHLFYCPCSRKELNTLGRHSDRCLARRQRNDDVLNINEATRIKHESIAPQSWQDLFQDKQGAEIHEDYVLKRRDGLYAYQLAVVSDDIDQGITHVIRGLDLLDSTPIQLGLYQALDAKPPTFGHFALITNAAGQKLSKQNLSPAIERSEALQNLRQVLQLIGYKSIPVLDIPDLLEWATKHWHRDKQRQQKSIGMQNVS